MEALCAEAIYCTQGEERAAALLESVRLKVGDGDKENKWLTLATSLCQRAIFELQTRAVEVDGLIEAGDASCRPLYTCPPLETLEALEANFTILGTNLWFKFINACETGNIGFIDLYILSGENPALNINAAIKWASCKGQLSVVNRLLKDERVDPSGNGNKNAAIIWASNFGHLSVVDRLLQDARVDPSAKNNRAIQFASGEGHLHVVERLLQDARVDPSVDDNWAIQHAFNRGHLSIVNRLLQDERVRSMLSAGALTKYRSRLNKK